MVTNFFLVVQRVQVGAAREPVHQPVEEVLLHEEPPHHPGPERGRERKLSPAAATKKNSISLENSNILSEMGTML
jgi:hypothetical protein